MSRARPLVVLDVQHAFRGFPHAKDRGARFVDALGAVYWEADLATRYAAAAAAHLIAAGVEVRTQSHDLPNLLRGPYSRRASEAAQLGADLYVACHVNAGGGRYARFPWHTLPSLDFARAIASQLGSDLRPPLSGVQTPQIRRGERGFVCIGLVKPPTLAVLCEPYFGDTPAHLSAFAGEAGCSRIGRSLALACLTSIRTLFGPKPIR